MRVAVASSLFLLVSASGHADRVVEEVIHEHSMGDTIEVTLIENLDTGFRNVKIWTRDEYVIDTNYFQYNSYEGSLEKLRGLRDALIRSVEHLEEQPD